MARRSYTARPAARKAKSGHDRIRLLSLDSIQPSPENERIYRPVDPEDAEVRALAESIREHGIREPLVVTLDGYILSGHRRHVAARLAGLESVPCRVEPIHRADDPDRFTVLLREYNRQRVKSHDELLREEVVSADPEEAYQALIDHRAEQSWLNVETIDIRDQKRRAQISDAKLPFLEAVVSVVSERRKFWPLSDRQIHYALLNDPPLIHAAKPSS